MIPLRDQDEVRAKFAAELISQVKIDFFTERESSIEVPGKTPCLYCKPTEELLREIAGLSDLVSLRIHYIEDNPEAKATYGVERIPAIVLRGQGPKFVKFYGMPGGTEFPTFIEVLVDISRAEALLSEESVNALQTLAGDVSLKVFVTPTCQYCPAMMRVAYQMAFISPHVTAEVIEVNEFPDLADKYKVQAVPLTIMNDAVAIPGMVHETQLVAEIVKLVGTTDGDTPAESAPPPEPPRPQRVERGKERPSGLFIP